VGNAGTLVSYRLRNGGLRGQHDSIVPLDETTGKKMNKKCFVVLGFLLIAAGFVFVDDRVSTKVTAVNLENLPLSLGQWQGKSYSVPERILEILETQYILDREYVNPDGRQLYLSIVYYPDNKIGFHNPESCNTGAGSKIVQRDVLPLGSGNRSSSLNGFKVNRLILERMQGNKVILYFFVSGNYITDDYLKFRWHMMKQQMEFKRPSGAQVQIHGAIAPDMKKTIATMEDFVQNLAPMLPKYLN
jgi:EpsI family protein